MVEVKVGCVMSENPSIFNRMLRVGLRYTYRERVPWREREEKSFNEVTEK